MSIKAQIKTQILLKLISIFSFNSISNKQKKIVRGKNTFKCHTLFFTWRYIFISKFYHKPNQNTKKRAAYLLWQIVQEFRLFWLMLLPRRHLIITCLIKKVHSLLLKEEGLFITSKMSKRPIYSKKSSFLSFWLRESIRDKSLWTFFLFKNK